MSVARKLRAFASAGAVLASIGGTPTCRADDLLEIYRQAQAADPVLAGATANRDATQELVVQARAALLPNASATVYAQRGRVGDLVPPDTRGNGAGLVVSQPLVDVAAHDRLEAATHQAQGQDATWRGAEEDLRLRVATAYFAVLTASDTLVNAQADEDALRQQVEQAGARQRAGLTAAVDVDQARAYFQGARARTIDAQRALDEARDALAQLTDRTAGELLGLRKDIASTAVLASENVDDWIARAMASNPELQAAREAATAAQAQVDAARAGHLPTLAAGLDVGRNVARPLPDTDDGHIVTTATLTLTVPLFAGGATQSLVRQALHQRDAARDALEAQRRQTVRDVRDRLHDTRAARAQERATAEGVQAAARALDATRVGQGVGTQTMTDLLLAIQTLASARDAYSQARHQAVLGTLQLARAAGTLGDTELAAVNGLLH